MDLNDSYGEGISPTAERPEPVRYFFQLMMTFGRSYSQICEDMAAEQVLQETILSQGRLCDTGNRRRVGKATGVDGGSSARDDLVGKDDLFKSFHSTERNERRRAGVGKKQKESSTLTPEEMVARFKQRLKLVNKIQGQASAGGS